MTITIKANTVSKPAQCRRFKALLPTLMLAAVACVPALQATTLDDYLIVQLAVAPEVAADNTAKSTATQQQNTRQSAQQSGQQVGGGEWLSFNSYIEAAQQALINDMGWQNVADLVSYQHVPYLAVPKSAADLKALRASGKVAKVFPNEFHLAKQASAALPQNLKMISPLPEMQQAGRGATVALIDDGVLSSHPALQGKIIAEACVSRVNQCQGSQFMEGKGAADPGDQTHGTHIAGIMVGPQGVAAASKLIAVKANMREGARIGYSNVDVISAIDWVVSQRARYDIAALNLSLGDDSEYTSQCDSQSVYAGAIKSAVQAGMVVVVAAGNEQHTNGLISPACVSDVISVGSVTFNRTVADYSNTAPYLSLLAPGDQIISTAVPAGMIEMSGTSMAAPHVTAAIALLKSQYPQATAPMLRRAIVQSRQQVQDFRTGRRTPLLDITASAQYLQSQFGTEAPALPVLAPQPVPLTLPSEPVKMQKPPQGQQPVQVQRPVQSGPEINKPAPVQPIAKPTPPAKKTPAKAKKPACAERVDGILVENTEDCAQSSGIDW